MKAKKGKEQRLQKIGERIRELRLGAGFSSYENFAVQYDLDRKYYWSVEKGRNLSLEYLMRILEIHNVSLEDFFKGMQ